MSGALCFLVFIFLSMDDAQSFRYKFSHTHYGLKEIRSEFGGDLLTAVFEIIEGFPITDVCICFDHHFNKEFLQSLLKTFLHDKIAVELFNITTIDYQEKYFQFLGNRVKNHMGAHTIFFASHKFYEHVLLEIYERDFLRRNVILIFYWGVDPFDRFFIRNIHHVMKVYVITNPRNDTYRVFYNRALPHKNHHLEMINWWSKGVGLFNHPTLPSKYNHVYNNFHGRNFKIPVIHKPPWHFVDYDNDSFVVRGGRDHRILQVLSEKLNFKYEYFDPPERIQGSSASGNGTFKGVLGLIWKRQADFFLGDVALSFERSNYVEFSFITLADSGAFLTHAPSKLNEALALLRPFHWQVWPAIGITFLIVGPVLYVLVALPNAWRPRFKVRSHARLFFDCTWFTTTVLLKQAGKEPSTSNKARFFIIILSISATYVINDMYSANLTSLLARPGREKAINTLHQLEQAMITKNYKLFVEKHSTSYNLFENGTGVYKNLWRMMNKQSRFLLESVEEGVKLVRDSNDVAVIAGRETLFFDSQRFGASNYHLSEKLNTAYSAIAFQLGCPYIEEINIILMAMFEAGLIPKMTQNEYEILHRKQKQTVNDEDTENNLIPGVKKETRRAAKANADNEKLQPISLKMLQGTFYLLGFGIFFSVGEILVYKHKRRYHKTTIKLRRQIIGKLRRTLVDKCSTTGWNIKRIYLRTMNDAFIETLEYLE